MRLGYPMAVVVARQRLYFTWVKDPKDNRSPCFPLFQNEGDHHSPFARRHHEAIFKLSLR